MIDYKIRTMTEEDYDNVHKLWMTIHGFAIRSIDDSREGVIPFLKRNKDLSVVAQLPDGEIVGSILVGHDGRRACLYHVCVKEDCRKQGIGKSMVAEALKRLKDEGISKVTIIAFTKNEVGNVFWKAGGWTQRQDVNTYDFVLNEENIVKFNS
ncbi:MAG: GNAT family N-acetyltransferase [Pseudobutyrivibrio sp.]|nr:GNAT family N-acetyltransferase [Pseudobutyrivibrio sp.]